MNIETDSEKSQPEYKYTQSTEYTTGGQYKAGYLTTEFWLSLVTAVVALAVNYGLVSQAQAEGWLQIGMILISILPTMVYTMSRTWLKK